MTSRSTHTTTTSSPKSPPLPFASTHHSTHKTLIVHTALLVALAAACALPTCAYASSAVVYHRPTDSCPTTHWLSTARNACVPCTECADDRSIVLRPCQPHRDTVCGTLNDLEFEWSWMAPPPVDASASAGGMVSHGDEWNEDTASVDTTLLGWQTASLMFAAGAFALFLVAVAYILFHHAKQWRHMETMERRFDRDVEQLSARLMHNIVDLRSIENGRIILNESPPLKDRPINPREVRCVYLEQLLIGKDLVNSPLRGNVYTEEAKG